jgi:class 3 adenylate cyclase
MLMAADDVIDIDGAPTDQRRRLIWSRIVIPIGGVALVIAAILAIALYSERENRAGVLRLSDDLLVVLQERVSTEVTGYLAPAMRALRLAHDIVARSTIADLRAPSEAFAWSALHEIPQIDAFYVADAQGNFMMLQRGATGGMDTKLIANAPNHRIVEWVRRDADDRITEQSLDPNDEYDPRSREWYQGALKADTIFWSDVYVFFTHRVPGITAAIHVRGVDGVDRVFGVDITLKVLSDFLASLKIGHTGRAVIFDDAGQLIAARELAEIQRRQKEPAAAVHVDELGDSALTAAYDRYRVEGYGRRVITVGNTRMVALVSRLPAAERNWSLLMVVPEKDFTGFIAANARTTLWLSSVVIVIVCLLAALLMGQGLRADRTARLLLERGRSVQRQGLALADLAHRSDLFDPARQAPLQKLTETLADLGTARRVSIWQLLNEGRLLDCLDAYEAASKEHTMGSQLLRAESPQFFAALQSGEEIEVANAANDRRTAELCRALMRPLDGYRLVVVPVRGAAEVVGAIMLEDVTRISDVREFAALAANLLVFRIQGDGDGSAMPLVGSAVTGPVAVGERSYVSELVAADLGNIAESADVFSSSAVMAISFNDGTAFATRDAKSVVTLADRIADALQDIAAHHDIPYVKLVGQNVVAAAGLVPDDTNAIHRIADASLAIRERCRELLETAGQPPSFGIGIDYGVAIGGHVGHQPRLFNLWGDAVRTAELMASSCAVPGTIQVSEAVHRRLRQHFLFRLRGSFYRPRLGTTETFILGGRQ